MESCRNINTALLKSGSCQRISKLNSDISFMMNKRQNQKTRNIKENLSTRRLKTEGKRKQKPFTEVISPSESTTFITLEGRRELIPLFEPIKPVLMSSTKNINEISIFPNEENECSLGRKYLIQPKQKDYLIKKNKLVNFIKQLKENKQSHMKRKITFKNKGKFINFKEKFGILRSSSDKYKKDISCSMAINKLFSQRALRNQVEANIALNRSQEQKSVDFTPKKSNTIFDKESLFESLDIKYPLENKRSKLMIKLSNFNSASKSLNKSIDLVEGRRIGRMRRPKPSQKAKHLLNFISNRKLYKPHVRQPSLDAFK
mmetsp:Transcript_12409/g.10997  ORF Transcript_12409/g.10997 Transcript_12409/m.10997 type:complete len:316 (+) Transcript_12409:19-966(+)